MTRAREETGIALVIVMFVILIAGLLGGAVVTGSIHTNSATARDTRLKAALGSADAGLEVATYRLNQLAPSAGNCVTNAVVAPTSGQCPQDGPESTGNGGTFSFWTSPVLASGSPCAGLQVGNGANTISQRCVTSIGTVNGISARVQARISAVAAIPLFPLPLLGVTGVTIGNSATVGGANPVVGVGPNALLSIGGGGGGQTTVSGYTLAPGATASVGNNVINTGTVTTLSAAQAQIPPIDWGNSPTVNDDCRIRNALAPGTGGIDPVTGTTCLADSINGGGTVTLNSSGVLSISGNNETLTLGGGRYYFCQVVIGNNARIAIAPGVKTQIFIDSSTRNGSPCPADPYSGQFTMNNGSSFITYPPATNTQVYVAGPYPVQLSNNAQDFMSVVAPLSTVTLSPSSNSSFTGAIEAYRVVLGNSTQFTFDGADATLQDAVQPLYHRTAWQQCPAAPSNPSDPTSGC